MFFIGQRMEALLQVRIAQQLLLKTARSFFSFGNYFEVFLPLPAGFVSFFFVRKMPYKLGTSLSKEEAWTKRIYG